MSCVCRRLLALDVEATKGCMLDALTVHDGNSTDHPVILGPVCGALGDPELTTRWRVCLDGQFKNMKGLNGGTFRTFVVVEIIS